MKLFFSDLDGTLLDHETYSYDKSLEGIKLLTDNNIPLIMISSKTFLEMKILHEELNLHSPFVFEGGGGIAYIKENTFHTSLNGEQSTKLLTKIGILEKYFSEKPRLLIDMTVEEVVKYTGLPKEKAVLAQKRETSIPFLLDNKNNITINAINSINSELKFHGLRLTKGGRFFHFSSINANKGFAIDKIISFYDTETLNGKILTAAVGDSENDIPMMEKVNQPYLVRKKASQYIETGIKNIIITKGIGPEGFTEAVKNFLKTT